MPLDIGPNPFLPMLNNLTLQSSDTPIKVKGLYLNLAKDCLPGKVIIQDAFIAFGIAVDSLGSLILNVQC